MSAATALRLVDVDEPPRPVVDRYRGRLFLTVSEAADLLHVDPRTLRRALETEEIAGGVKVGAQWRIAATSVWLLAGLDPQTLRAPITGAAVRPEAASEADPAAGTGLEDDTCQGALDDHHPPAGIT